MIIFQLKSIYYLPQLRFPGFGDLANGNCGVSSLCNGCKCWCEQVRQVVRQVDTGGVMGWSKALNFSKAQFCLLYMGIMIPAS